VAKSHHHNTKKTNKTQHTQAAVLHPDRTGRRVSFRTSSGCMDPTDADAGRTDVSVDPARRNDRTPRGRSSRRRRQRPRRRSLTLRLALQPLLDDRVDSTPTQDDGPGSGSSRRPIGTHSCCCLRRRPRCQPTYPGSRLVRRADAAPCVLRNSALEPQFPAACGGSTHDAKLHFASPSLSDSALSHLAHTVEL